MKNNTIYTTELLDKLGLKDINVELQKQDNFTIALVSGKRRTKEVHSMGVAKFDPKDTRVDERGNTIATARAIKSLCVNKLGYTTQELRGLAGA